MRVMRDLLVLKTDLTEFNKLKVNRKFYQSLKVDGLVIEIFEDFSRGNINDIFFLNEYYREVGINIVIRFDIKTLMENLIDTDSSFVDFSKPNIRKSLYHFISYLIKHGIRAFDLMGLENLSSKEKALVEAIRELNKNTFFNRKVLSMAEISTPGKTLMALSNPALSCLSLVRCEGEIEDIFNLSREFVRAKSGLCLTLDNFSKNKINFINYPTYARKMILMTIFFLKASLYIEEKDLDVDDVIFLRKLFILNKYLSKMDKITKILPREKDILAFIREGKGEKVLFMANLTEKEVLVDLAFKVMDYKEYEYLIGSITRRVLFKTILLRPYEAIAFIKL